jgi:predicted nucleic acid-binding protein
MNSLPAGPLLFDTGIYIRFSRGEDYPWLIDDEQIFGRTFLTAVVAAELYAGTRDRHEKRSLDELCRAYQMLGHFLSPSSETWVDSGMLLRRARSTSGQMTFAQVLSRRANRHGSHSRGSDARYRERHRV